LRSERIKWRPRMSQDRTEREYHLTANGWVAGSFYVYGTKTEDVPIPLGRVETWVEEIDDPSGWSPPVVSWRRIWTSDLVPPTEIAGPHTKFPPPKHVPWKKYPRKKRKFVE
jgi:hypothetical protein